MNVLANVLKMFAAFVVMAVMWSLVKAIQDSDDTEIMKKRFIPKERVIIYEYKPDVNCIRVPSMGLEDPVENKHLWVCAGSRVRIKTPDKVSSAGAIPTLPVD